MIPKMLFFRLSTKSSKVIAENRFRTVASPGACERLAVLNWRSSSIHRSSYFWHWYCPCRILYESLCN